MILNDFNGSKWFKMFKNKNLCVKLMVAKSIYHSPLDGVKELSGFNSQARLQFLTKVRIVPPESSKD